MKILFVCKRNEFRSPIAEAIASKILGKGNVCSAGTNTRASNDNEAQRLLDREHQVVYCKFMQDQGHEGFGEYRPRKVTEEMVDSADVVVDMAEPEYELGFIKNSTKTVHWEIENPRFKEMGFDEGYKKVGEIYNILEKKIKDLINAKSTT
ncbi:MAG: hypothetical protein V4469_00695 [Patescibacteria group bacterium]